LPSTAFDRLKPFEIDAHVRPGVAEFLREVGPNDADHAGVGEKGGGGAGITDRAAQNFFALFRGRFNGVDPDGSNDGQVYGRFGHGNFQSVIWP